jgi:hypothetical protein
VSFLLCDPGLIIPPPQGGDEHLRSFWLRVIEWSTDRRLKLGPESFHFTINLFGQANWAFLEHAACSVDARSALNRLLASVQPAANLPDSAPSLTPRYTFIPEGERALARDLGATWREELLALASRAAHWNAASLAVELRPPPPASVPLVTSPNQPIPREVDLRVGEYLLDKRITLVGALHDDRFLRLLCRTFKISMDQVRWIESEPNREPQLDALKGLSGNRDVVCCILGAPGQLGLGHAGSEKAKRMTMDRGAELLAVSRPNEVLGALRERFGVN